MAKNNFLFTTQYNDELDNLSDEDLASLVRALYRYQATGEEPELNPIIGLLFRLFKKDIDKNNAQYEAQCQRNRENGRSGGRPRKKPEEPTKTDKNPVGFSETQSNPENPDNDKDNDRDIDNDIKEKNISKKKSAENVISLYNKICVSLPKVMKVTDSRIKTVNARLKDTGIEDIQRCFAKAQDSSFLTGSNGFQASFDWLMNPSNMAKVLEGNYDNRKKASTRAAPTKFTNFLQRQTDYDELERQLIAKSMKG